MQIDISLLPTVIGRRYKVLSEIGSGGMGTIYCAQDRLTGQLVALKRVTVPNHDLEFASLSGKSDIVLSLTQEFRILSSLRHPHIISVLDYGLDDQKKPFFAMTLLEHPRTILAACQDNSLPIQINFLIQVLEALIYLHRRGVVHRDIKPGNILVDTQDQIKVVDFGLAITSRATQNMAGTTSYMAPEVLAGTGARIESDLFAVGVLAYEILAQKHPFRDHNLNEARTMLNIMTLEPDFSLISALQTQFSSTEANGQRDLSLPGKQTIHRSIVLSDVIRKLLAKDVKERYHDAQSVIIDLCEATGRPIPEESTVIRDSFLQAATFVGREQEILQLSNGLTQIQEGRGSAWLVGGESGIGKSRLVEELRILALTAGVLVLRGQALSERSATYQLWRSALRWLLLVVDVNALEVSVIKPLIPDVDILLEREVPDPPELDASIAQERLLVVVENLFQRYEYPLLIILEDLQWAASEDLILLARISRLAAVKPFLIIGSYRDDEFPNLPKKFPDMQVLHLQRLASNNIAELSLSMLGSAGERTSIVNLLERETEGNVFFIIEVLRALADEAGRLDKIEDVTLPQSTFTGGVRVVIRRRLSQLPSQVRPLLNIAAAAGRQIDLAVLQQIESDIDLQNWLNVCAEYAILDIFEGGWRFAHDKLREGILLELSDGERQRLHSLVATAIEQINQGKLEQVAGRLAFHWNQAGDVSKETYYTVLAGEQALTTGAYQEAVVLLTHAAELYNQGNYSLLQHSVLRRHLADAYLGLGQLTDSRVNFERSLAALGKPVPTSGLNLTMNLSGAILRQAMIRFWPSRFIGKTRDAETQVISIEALRAYNKLAEIYYHANSPFQSLNAGVHSLNLSEELGHPANLVIAYPTMGIVTGTMRMNGLARAYIKWGEKLAKEIDNPGAKAQGIMAAGVYRLGVGDWNSIVETMPEAIALCDRIGNWRLRGMCVSVLANLMLWRGDIADGIAMFGELLEVGARSRDIQLQVWGLLGQAEGHLIHGDFENALKLFSQAEVLLGATDNTSQTRIYAGLAAVHWQLSTDKAKASPYADKALALIVAQPLPNAAEVINAYINTAEVYLAMWQSNRSQSPDSLDNQVKLACAGLKRYASIFGVGLPANARLKGQYQYQREQPTVALKTWQKGLALAERFGMKHEIELLQNEIAKVQSL